MRIDEIRLLYDYNYWANGRLLAAAARLNPARFTEEIVAGQPSLRATLLHALDAEFGWRLLLQHGRPSPILDDNEFPTVAVLAARWQEEEREMRGYLAALNDDEVVGVKRFTSESGEPRERLLWHCLLHVVNHGTQHRSEAALLLTAVGCSPGEVDFAVFLGERDRED